MRTTNLAFRIYLGAIIVFMLAPILVIVAVAFTSSQFASFPPRGFSLRWFHKVFEDPVFVLALWNSVRLGITSTVVASLVTIPATLVLVRYPSAFAQHLQAFMLSPLSLPTIILAVGLLFMNARIGLESSFWALVAGHTVIVVPYVMRAVFGVYAGASYELEYAAAVHGANPLRVFVHVTLPMLRPGIVAGAIFGFLMSFDEVSVALLLSDSRTVTLPVAILSYLVNNSDPAVAAVSTIQMAIAVCSLVVLERFFGVRRLMFPSR